MFAMTYVGNVVMLSLIGVAISENTLVTFPHIASTCQQLTLANYIGTDGNGRVLCLWHSVSLNIINTVSVWE